MLTVGTGNVDLENLKVQNLEADCGIGNIDLDINGKEIRIMTMKSPVPQVR